MTIACKDWTARRMPTLGNDHYTSSWHKQWCLENNNVSERKILTTLIFWLSIFLTFARDVGMLLLWQACEMIALRNGESSIEQIVAFSYHHHGRFMTIMSKDNRTQKRGVINWTNCRLQLLSSWTFYDDDIKSFSIYSFWNKPSDRNLLFKSPTGRGGATEQWFGPKFVHVVITVLNTFSKTDSIHSHTKLQYHTVKVNSPTALQIITSDGVETKENRSIHFLNIYLISCNSRSSAV